VYTGDFLRNILQNSLPVTPLDLGGSVTGAAARLDLLHPIVSGNKLFKLWYYLDRYRSAGGEGITTFGGAYSNHLVATAYACREMGIPCRGIVRGEEPETPGATLEDCRRYGMDLRFVSREEYRLVSRDACAATFVPGGPSYIPEGGAGPLGVMGASLILRCIPDSASFSHILLALGTGTTLQGIDSALLPGQSALGVPVIAVPPPEQQAFADALECSGATRLVHGYAFGGYGRRTPELTAWMRTFFETQGVPTDFVYTAKAAFALMDLVRQGAFPPGSRILFLHTGGLQGNRSLPRDLLAF
jgi:1-aminocyclopropane-1-carboxylate deaminase/D-cysteine desulfhydrase-like pyridoxal-dependent ACC family enzyme